MATTNEDTAVTTTSVLSNDSDIDGDAISVAAGNPTATNGTVVNNNNGTFTYTPNTGFIGSDSFTYTVSDTALTDTGTVNITVNGLGTAIDMNVLMGPANGGVTGFESFTDANSPTGYEYWSDTFNSSTNQLVFVDAMYNRSTAAFDTIAGVGDGLALSPSGTWEQAAKIDLISFGTGTGGVANYYFIDHHNVNPAQVVSAPTASTWVRDSSVHGVDMIRYTVPSSFKVAFPNNLNEGLNSLLAVQNSFVRGGDFSLTGESFFDFASPLVNGIAKDQILANFFLAAPALACGTVSGAIDDPVTGIPVPITPFTFAQFEGLVDNCTSGAGTVAITVADIKGKRFLEFDEITQFDNTGSGTLADQGHGILDVGNDDIPIAWYLETSGNNTYIVLSASVATGTSAGTVNFREHIALTALTAGTQGSVGATYSSQYYTEVDIGNATIDGSNGEIWNSTVQQIQLP